MSFLKGKIKFTPLRVQGRSLPDALTIESKIVMHPYQPIERGEISRMSFVNPTASIKEEFEETYENPIFRDFVLAGIVIEQRKVDMAKVKARTKVEFAKAMAVMKTQGIPGLGKNKINKNEIKARIIEEELPNAPIVHKVFEVLFSPRTNMIFVSTASKNVIDAIVDHIKFVVFGYRPSQDPKKEDEDSEERGDFIISNVLSSSFVNKSFSTKLAAFCFVDGQETPPVETEDYMREWLTWMLLKCLNVLNGNMRVEVDKTIRLMYSSNSDLEQSQFKARNDNIPIMSMGVGQIAEGALVDEISLFTDEDIYNMGTNGHEFKVNKAGFISNLDAPALKPKEKNDMLPFIMEGVDRLTAKMVAHEQAFFKLRTHLSSWTDEVVNMRAMAIEYAEQNMDHELKLIVADPV